MATADFPFPALPECNENWKTFPFVNKPLYGNAKILSVYVTSLLL